MIHRSREVADLVSFGMLFHDGEAVVDVNAAALPLLGASTRRQVLGLPVHTLLERPYLKAVGARLRGDLPADATRRFEVERVYGLDGQVREVEMCTQLLLARRRALVLVEMRDLSAARLDEARVRYDALQRLADESRAHLRALSGGVAHEINNAMQVVVGYASMLADQPLPRDHATDVNAILAASGRVASTVQRLLELAGATPCVPRACNLWDAVRQAIEQFAPGVLVMDPPSGRQATPRDGADTGPSVQVDRQHLRTMLSILFSNARQAVRRGGQVRVRVREVQLERAETASGGRTRPAGRYATVEVEDSGIGMSLPVQASMGRPFLSRWPMSDGAGLGLAALHGLLAQNAAYLTFDSHEFRGSTFTVWFLVERAVTASVAEEAVVPVLLVEADPVLRRSLEDTLRRGGLEVWSCRSTEEAVEVLAHRGRPALILCALHPSGLPLRAFVTTVDAMWGAVTVLVMGSYGTTLADETVPAHDCASLPSGARLVSLLGPLSDYMLLRQVYAALPHR